MDDAGSLRTVIISDLHISSGPLDDFDPQLENHLVAFLDSLSSTVPVELIINGDFLDFVQAPPWSGRDLEASAANGTPLCFTEEQSLRKLSAILEAHPSTVEALARFAVAHSDNRVVILPGNHDPDFFWPSVQSGFREALRRHAAVNDRNIEFFLEPVRRVGGNPAVWVEHGHRYDPVNSFSAEGTECWSSANPPIRHDKKGVLRLVECTGTRFLIKYLNGLDARYPFVDNVKPFSRFLRIFGASAFIPGYGPLKAALALWAMLRYLTGIALVRPSDLLGVDEKTAPDLNTHLLSRLKKVPPAKRAAFIADAEQNGFDFGGRSPENLLGGSGADAFLTFLAENPQIVEHIEAPAGALSAGGVPGTLTLSKGFRADETGDLIKAATKISQAHPELHAVVMGHTHEAVETAAGAAYFNTGSWTRYYRFEKKEATRPWSLLIRGGFDEFPYRLLYVDVPPNGAPAMRQFAERLND